MKHIAGLMGLATLRVMTMNAGAPQLRALSAMLIAIFSVVVAPAFAEINDDHALRSYVFTSHKLRRYAELSATLKHEKAHDLALRAEAAASPDSGGDTLAESVAAPVVAAYADRWV